jgi:hypothetical protein
LLVHWTLAYVAPCVASDVARPSRAVASCSPLLRRRYFRRRGAILVGGVDSHDPKGATIICRRPGMYVVVELIEGRRILLVRLHRDTSSDGNPSVRCQQAVFMLPHNHVRRRWTTYRNKKPACNHRGHCNTAKNLHGSPQVNRINADRAFTQKDYPQTCSPGEGHARSERGDCGHRPSAASATLSKVSTKDETLSAELHGEALLTAKRPELQPLIGHLREVAQAATTSEQNAPE